MANEVATIEQNIFSLAPQFQQLCADRSISFAREAEFAIQALYASDFALKIARENPQSVRDAVTNIAAIGISLNPAKKQAYLVPRQGKITLMISYMGLLDLAIQSGSILWGQAELVYAADLVAPCEFTLNGFDQPPTHKREPFSTQRGELVGVYVVVKTKDGDYLTGTMTAKEVFDIRDRSDAWKAYLKDKRKCPWVTDEGEMVKKTVIKRHYKTWPKTDRLDKAIHHLNTDGGEGISFNEDDPLNQPKYLGLGDHAAVQAKKVRQAAGAALERFNVNDELGMWGEVCDLQSEEEKNALWLALKPFSDCKAAIKRMAEEERAGQAKLDAERKAA